uniref:interstitial collagenase n=1 Tax=Callorhinchus milii TaxID=7868 RepID=A0A4W3H4A1_CALMI
MKKPRCGVSDIGEYSVFRGRPKWNKNDIKYSIENYTPDMKRSDVDIILQRALKLWSDVTPLRFTRSSSSQADIKISFSSRDHGDGHPFDGPTGILAHAFSPSSGLGGDTHFDLDERWTKDSRDFNLFLVAGHEFGHALGLDHSNDRKALMFPTYLYVNTNGYKLPADDVRGIQSIYGPPTSAPVPKPPITPRPPKCNPKLSIDAATKLKGDTLFFKDMKNSRTSKVVTGFIKSTWPTVPSSIDAAFEFSQGYALLFKGSKYWAISGNSVLRGFPRSISDFNIPQNVRKIDAAVRISAKRKILFFVGNRYWSYDECRRQMDPGYPRLIAGDFKGFRSKVDAVFHNDGECQFDSKYNYIFKTTG